MFDRQRDPDDSISPVRRRLSSRMKSKREYSLSPVKKRPKKNKVKMRVESEKRKREYSQSPVRKRLKKNRVKTKAESEKRKREYSQSPVRKRLKVKRAGQFLQDDVSSVTAGHPTPSAFNNESGGLRRATNSKIVYPSPNMELQTAVSTSGSISNLQHVPAPRPPEQPALHISPTSARVRGAYACRSCPNRFPSYESLEYHRNLKTRALRKCKILVDRFSTDLHIAICPIRSCCYSSHKVEVMEEHLALRHRHVGKHYLTGEGGTFRELYVILKHSPTEKGTISCPACQRHFMNAGNLTRHQAESCRGFGQHSCVICATYFRDRRQMMNHMKTAHPPPPGVTITGMFMGKLRERQAERTERSIDAHALEPLAQFTFIPEQPIVTSASEFFTPSTSAGLTWLIQRARSLSGNSILRLNASSLIRQGKSKKLIVFDTQATLLSFTASESPIMVSRR